MPRAIWSGSISFGLVNIPIKLYNAVSRKNVSFNQIDSRTGSRIKMQRVSTADGSEVPYEAIVKGYELSPDHFVLIEPDELDGLDPVRESIWLNETFFRETALNSLTGMLTKPKLIDPLQMARATSPPQPPAGRTVSTSSGDLSIL